MNEKIRHRGPDQQSVWHGDKTSLAFSRLSIIDLSEAGSQPMFSLDGKFAIVFNGEVYNYIELKKELLDKGYHFKSQTDTEVVLNSFIEWGDRCVEHFQGMFAFAIVNTESEDVFIARDQLGIKTLYHLEHSGIHYFASEIKAFLSVTALAEDTSVLFEQLCFRYVAGEKTPFRNIRRIESGSFEIYSQGTLKTKTKYYSITKSFEPPKSFKWSIEEIKNILLNSINLHTRSDVGYNVQLSGGLDSSFLTAILAKSNTSLRTYSIGLKNSKHDERYYQNIIQKQFHTNHYSIEMDSHSFVDSLKLATYHMDLPVIHYGCVLLMNLCFESQKTSKVIITGEGADEVFAGYTRYKFSKLIKLTHFLQHLGIKENHIPSIGKLKLVKQNLKKHPSFIQAFVNPEIVSNFINHLEEHLDHRISMFSNHLDSLSKQLCYDQQSYLSSLLERQDKLSMAASVEARVPYCFTPLFNYVNSIPSFFKIQKNETKFLLKQIANEFLPKEIIYRSKVGLTLPLADWLRSGPLNETLGILRDKHFLNNGIFNHSLISKNIDDHIHKKADNSKILMSLLTTEIWRRTFITQQKGSLWKIIL